VQELTKAVETAVDDKTGQGQIDLNEAGKKWAMYCLSAMKGKLLKRGLKISEAITNFDIELRYPGGGND